MSNLNKIEQIQKLYAVPKSYLIPKEPKEGKEQISIQMMPLGIKEMGLMNMKEDSSPEEISKNMTKLWSVSLQIEEEEAEKISIEFMKDLMDAFMDANDFKDEDINKSGIKKFIESKQEKVESSQ